jgi:hypothetical protein
MANPGPATTVTPNYIFNGDASNGVLLGGAASNLVGFHGATPVAQAAAIAVPTDLATSIVAITAIITVLKNKGLTA